ncbi:hypothetical protein L3Q82_016835 [Scortum barcoo]|uniref:Uncharacterized protein n=1 Tax=Scortum barcoo TaxID=214431 RepID=A0ACB8X8R7_9TELE|nr:hypothetical protein L3Q82_016835 [Scortum barcoo]
MIFKSELNHKTRCLKCKETNNSRSFFWMLPLVVEDKHHQTYSVEKGLKAFFKREKVCGDNKMFCNRCKKKQDADFGCEITQNPKILTLLLKRFSFDYKRWCYVKLHREVDVPLTLDMKKCTYDLYALVNHFGDLTGGHYTAQIKSFETRVWYHFNDDIVQRVRQPLFGSGDKSLRSCTAYLLMYKRKFANVQHLLLGFLHFISDLFVFLCHLNSLRGNPEKNDEGDQEAHSAQMSDVEAEGRHDDAEGGEALDEICNGAESMDLNGDIFKKKKLTNFPGEMKKTHNRRAESMRPRKEIQTNSGADRDCYKLALRAQEPHFAKLRKDRGESRKPNRQYFETNSEEHTRHLNIRGAPTKHWRTHHVDGVLEPNRESQKKRQNSIVAKTGKETASGIGAKTKAVKDKIKSNSTKKDEEEIQHAVAAGSGCKRDSTQTRGKGEKKLQLLDRKEVLQKVDKLKKGGDEIMFILM